MNGGIFKTHGVYMVLAWLAPLTGTRAPAQSFTDVSQSAGITHVQSTPSLVAGLPGSSFLTGGVAAGDFDGDGHTDLLFTRLNATDLLYRNLGDGTFEARSASAGFTVPTLTNGVVSGDIDNDGDLDVYMTGTAGATRNYLYLNDGTGFFTDVGLSRTATLSNGISRNGQGASFGDYNQDGFLDLITADWGNEAAASQSRLLENHGSTQPGFFDDVTATAGIDVYRKQDTERFSPRLIDLDRDGHLDLAIAADFKTSQLFWSQGDGTFVDGTLSAGVGTDFNGMGSTFGDYDGDGDLDWFITNITADPAIPSGFGGWNRLYRNDGDRQFTDVTAAAGVRDSRWSWGTSFFDYDNDGDVDLVATNGYNGPGFQNDRSYLWRNDGGIFTDVSDTTGVTDTLQGRGLAHLDFDSDGDLDFVIVNNQAQPILYRNDGGNDNDYLRIRLIGTQSNRDGIGAFITVTPDLVHPQQRLIWDIDGGSSFLSQNERIAHFGLGPSADAVSLVTIQWTSGNVQHLHGVAVNQTLTVIESALETTAGDLNFDGDTNTNDIDWLRIAARQPQLYQSVFGIPAERSADLNGDNRLDSLDADHLLTVILGKQAGDLNLDGNIDSIDIALWHSGFGAIPEPDHAGGAPWPGYARGDIDGDGDTDGSDFLMLQRGFTSIPPSFALSQGVPEPGSHLVGLVTMLLLVPRRRRPLLFGP